mmetsp:Transcript_14473/g.43338  ORF Transcript_14473/g.43338 Transcript_14473/m.43338 type:complete len:113 (-) Transcript_14473:1-339(-)
MNSGRLSNFSYTFRFAEDLKSADIEASLNPACCCCPFPCIPAWFTVPRCITEQSMRLAQGGDGGVHWERFSGFFGAEQTKLYDLLQVSAADGTPGPYAEKISEAPEQVMITH